MSRVKQIDRIESLEAQVKALLQVIAEERGLSTDDDEPVATFIPAPKVSKAATVVQKTSKATADDPNLPATKRMTWALKMAQFGVSKVLGVSDAAEISSIDFRDVPVLRGECVEVISHSIKAKNGTANAKLSVAGELAALYNVALKRLPAEKRAIVAHRRNERKNAGK